MRKENYIKMYTAVYKKPHLSVFLNALSLVITCLTVLTYSAFAVYFAITDTLFGIKLITVSAIPFFAVTLMRRVIDAPRPYQIFECEGLAPLTEGGKRGDSFPSRHVASSFIIGSAFTFILPWVGITLMALGVILGACRVLLGRHFLRDVIVGAIIGGISGAVGMLIITLL